MYQVPRIFHKDPRLSVPNSVQNQEKSILGKIWHVARVILIGLAGAAMFATNPTLFTLGFISGIIWDAKVQEITDKIKSIWKSQTGGVLLLAGIASFLALQVTWAAGSIFYAANLGRCMVQRAQRAVNSWDDTDRMHFANEFG